jgi:hypothetical protein
VAENNQAMERYSGIDSEIIRERESIERPIAAAMKSMVGKFNEKSYSSSTYEDFLTKLQEQSKF